ncbi:hypothetical protein [uncultured Litoreibacter sp.]|uniref:hypothetical protein n=1 Tax=uncultured Litoreibacter sp. TaxID=1392394 RepID=UPI002624D327|nr:hypothetical protein [uncultured Litoreibacter sp.]
MTHQNSSMTRFLGSAAFAYSLTSGAAFAEELVRNGDRWDDLADLRAQAAE